MKRALKWLVLLVVVVAVGGLGYRKYRDRAPEPIQYRTATVEKGQVSAQVTATGTLSALVTVEVGSQVSGRLTEINVDFNSTVKKGQVLAKLDPQLFMATVQRERANLQAAKGSLSRAEAQAMNAERQYNRAKALVEGSIGNVSDRDAAQTAYEVAKADIVGAKAGIEQARASLHTAQINLQYTTILSPVDGTVISRSVAVGQTVAASLSAPVLFTIAGDLAQMQVDSSVAEADVGKLKPGMPALFTVDAYPGQNFKGTVRQIRNAPQSVQNVVTYDAVIDVANPELLLKPGMTANVRFIWAERTDVIRVANAALRFHPPPEAGLSAEPVRKRGAPGAASAWAGRAREGGDGPPGAGSGAGDGQRGGRGERGSRGEGPPGGRQRPPGGGRGKDASDRRTVYVLRNGAPVRVPVKVGITDGTTTEIVGGELQEGDQVIVDATVPEGLKAPASKPGGMPGASPPTRGMGRIL
jgi:HlyD family secretion protein